MISTQILQPADRVYFCWVRKKKRLAVSHTWQVYKILTCFRTNKSPFTHQSCPVKPNSWRSTHILLIKPHKWCWQRLISPGCSKASWEVVLYPFRKTRNIKYYTCLNTRTLWKQWDPFQWENLDSWVKPCFPKANKQNKYFDSFLDKREFSSKFNIILFIHLFIYFPTNSGLNGVGIA